MVAGQDGAEIVFWADGQVCVMRADGSDERFLTARELDASFPAWSPDGTKIALASGQTGFHSTRDGAAIYVMDADGSRVRRLTFNTTADTHPDWR